MSGKIGKPDARAKLPEERQPELERRLIDPDVVFRGVCAGILDDPMSTASDKLRAAEVFLRLRPEQPPAAEELARAEVAGLSTEQLDELLSDLLHPLHLREPREIERELEARTAKLEAEFEQRVEARVREFVDVATVEARVERRAREIAAQTRPLAEAPLPAPAVASLSTAAESQKLVDWPPDRQKRQPRRLG